MRGAFRRIIENWPTSANQINSIADTVGAAGFRGLFVRGTIPLLKRLQLALKSPLAMGEQNEKSNRRCFQEKSNCRCFIMGGAIVIATAIFIFALIRLVCVDGIRACRSLVRPISEKLDAFRQTDNAPPKLIANAAFHCGRALLKIFSRHPRLQARDRAC